RWMGGVGGGVQGDEDAPGKGEALCRWVHHAGRAAPRRVRPRVHQHRRDVLMTRQEPVPALTGVCTKAHWLRITELPEGSEGDAVPEGVRVKEVGCTADHRLSSPVRRRLDR